MPVPTLPPTDPRAEYITKDRETSCRSNRFSEAEIRYNVEVTAARRARGELPPAAPKVSTRCRDGWKKLLEILQ
jgi:hypothetical protein